MQLLPLVRAIRSAFQDLDDYERTLAWNDLFTRAYGRPPYDEAELREFVKQMGAR